MDSPATNGIVVQLVPTLSTRSSDILVHTVESREHLFLGILSDEFKMSGMAMRREIVEGVKETRRLLSLKRIDYAELRACLTPQSQKAELAFFVDSSKVGNDWYSPPVHRRILPLLRDSGPHAVLHGDLLFESELGDRAWRILSKEVRCPRPVEVPYLIQIYCVYVNNCSRHLAASLIDQLVNETWFIGYADVTLSSPLKTYLSFCIGQGYLTVRDNVVQPHPDDAPEGSDENTLSFPFEDADFVCRSIPDLYFGLFLSYKIERAVLRGFERDQLHTLNAVTDSPVDISKCKLVVPDEKLDHLRREKSGTLRRLGVLEEPKATLEGLIRAKLRSNYVYNLRFRPDFGVSTFNIMLELVALDSGEPIRTVASFAYEADQRAIRLVTLY